MNTKAERTVIENWDGPVCVQDRYFDDIQEAVEYYYDDAYNMLLDRVMITEVPEFIECCDEKLPSFRGADWIVEHIAGDYAVADDVSDFDDAVSGEKRAELDKLITDWIASVGWKYWEGNNTYIRLRPLVEEHERTQHEMH